MATEEARVRLADVIACVVACMLLTCAAIACLVLSYLAAMMILHVVFMCLTIIAILTIKTIVAFLALWVYSVHTIEYAFISSRDALTPWHA
jgi:hypothetical protein